MNTVNRCCRAGSAQPSAVNRRVCDCEKETAGSCKVNSGVQNCKTEKMKMPSLVMAYIPNQPYSEEDLYSPAEALTAGTLFKCLDMPFHTGFRI